MTETDRKKADRGMKRPYCALRRTHIGRRNASIVLKEHHSGLIRAHMVQNDIIWTKTSILSTYYGT